MREAVMKCKGADFMPPFAPEHVFAASLCLSFSLGPVLLEYACINFALATRVRFPHLLQVFCGELRGLEPLEKQAMSYHRERATWLPCTW